MTDKPDEDNGTENLGSLLPERTVLKLRSLKHSLAFYEDSNGAVSETNKGGDE